MKKIILLLICFLLFSCKNKFEEKKEALETTIWITVSQKFEDYQNPEKNYDYEYLENEQTIHQFTNDERVFIFDYKGKIIDSFICKLLKEKRDVKRIIIFDDDESEFIPIITKGYLELNEANGATVTTTRLIPLTDSILINKINPK